MKFTRPLYRELYKAAIPGARDQVKDGSKEAELAGRASCKGEVYEALMRSSRYLRPATRLARRLPRRRITESLSHR